VDKLLFKINAFVDWIAEGYSAPFFATAGILWLNATRFHPFVGLAVLANPTITAGPLLEIKNRNVMMFLPFLHPIRRPFTVAPMKLSLCACSSDDHEKRQLFEHADRRRQFNRPA